MLNCIFIMTIQPLSFKNIKRVIFIILITMLIFPSSASTSNQSENVITLSIPVIQDSARFLDLLEYPSYLAVALENNGIILKKHSKIQILDNHSLEIMGVTIKYIKRSDNLFFYQIKYGPININNILLNELTLEIDTSKVNQWVVRITIPSLLMRILPSDLTDRIKMKARILTDIDNQKQMVSYFNKIYSINNQTGNTSQILEKILINAYNLRPLDKSSDASNQTQKPYILLLLIFIMFCLVAINIYALIKIK